MTDLDPVRPWPLGHNRPESIPLKPDAPITRLTEIDREDMTGGTLAGQKCSPIRMHRAAVHEGGVRKFTPLPDGTASLDSPDEPRPLVQRAPAHPKHDAGIKRKSHGRRREFREWGCCACVGS
jgi:hypothetical protein